MPATVGATARGWTTKVQTTSARRVAVYSDPRQIRCPRCNTALSRLTARSGDVFITCENRRHVPGTNERKHCGQHIYLLQSPSRLFAVVAITREEYDLTSGCDDAAARLLHNLGILPAAYAALADARAA